MTACPKLTELTVIAPYPDGAKLTETGILLDPAGRAREAISELVVACKALPDFDTLQIVCYHFVPPRLACWCGWDECGRHRPSAERWEQALEKQTKYLERRAIECLKKSKMGCQEGKERKRVTLRVTEFSSSRCPVKIGEHEV